MTLEITDVIDTYVTRSLMYMQEFGMTSAAGLYQSTLEDAVITAADSVCLVVGKVTVLLHFHIVHGEVSGNAVDSGSDFHLVQSNRSFRNDVARAVADEDFNSDAGIFCFLVCQVNKCSGNSVCHLIRVAGIYFFKHGVTPFSHGAGAP